MDIETPKQKIVGAPDSDSGTAQGTLERGAEAYGPAEKAVGDVYDKTAHAVSEAYEQTRNYSKRNPNKAILIALGIGGGLGFLLGARSRRSSPGRLARPIVDALSELFR